MVVGEARIGNCDCTFITLGINCSTVRKERGSSICRVSGEARSRDGRIPEDRWRVGVRINVQRTALPCGVVGKSRIRNHLAAEGNRSLLIKKRPALINRSAVAREGSIGYRQVGALVVHRTAVCPSSGIGAVVVKHHVGQGEVVAQVAARDNCASAIFAIVGGGVGAIASGEGHI